MPPRALFSLSLCAALAAGQRALPSSGSGLTTPLAGAYVALAPCNVTVTISGAGGGGGYSPGVGGNGARFTVTFSSPPGLVWNATAGTGGLSGASGESGVGRFGGGRAVSTAGYDTSVGLGGAPGGWSCANASGTWVDVDPRPCAELTPAA